ncbi:hypothetical protein HK096_003896 [Nowakowskiella sp. JEL0078]|nr:hypothetical protein HK096_003896 [Nowakowskiella sp. JEL0078]
MPKRLIVCRHGYRQDWETVMSPDNDTGRVNDNFLSGFGKSQAISLAQHLKQTIPSHSKIVLLSSPYLRTLQTATPISDAFGVPIKVEPGLRENFEVNHKSATPFLPINEIRNFLPKLNIDLDYVSYQNVPSELKTTRLQLIERAKILAQNIVNDYKLLSEDEEDVTVIAVTHAATKIVFVREIVAITGLTKVSVDHKEGILQRRRNSLAKKLEVRCGVCSATVLQPSWISTDETDDESVRSVEWKLEYDTSYLEKGEIRNWAFPDEVIGGLVKAA